MVGVSHTEKSCRGEQGSGLFPPFAALVCFLFHSDTYKPSRSQARGHPSLRGLKQKARKRKKEIKPTFPSTGKLSDFISWEPMCQKMKKYVNRITAWNPLASKIYVFPFFGPSKIHVGDIIMLVPAQYNFNYKN